MPFNNYLNDILPDGQPEDHFSLVDFLAEAPDYFAHEPFTIHVSPRSSGINEYLNLKIQLKMGRLSRLKNKISTQLQAFSQEHTPAKAPPTENTPPNIQEMMPSPEIPSQSSSQEKQDVAKLIYHKGGKMIEIAVSEEQLKNYFESTMTEAESNGQDIDGQQPKKEDIFDRFLHEPGFFKRSEHPEEIPPDQFIEASVTENDEIVTETLAKINLLQGNHAEARRIYQKLGLLFPEKSAYFEAQTKKIQDLDTTNDA